MPPASTSRALHLHPLDFPLSLSGLPALTSEQLAHVQFHDETPFKLTHRARIALHRRRNASAKEGGGSGLQEAGAGKVGVDAGRASASVATTAERLVGGDGGVVEERERGGRGEVSMLSETVGSKREGADTVQL